jgi:hypothetical protein
VARARCGLFLTAFGSRHFHHLRIASGQRGMAAGDRAEQGKTLVVSVRSLNLLAVIDGARRGDGGSRNEGGQEKGRG